MILSQMVLFRNVVLANVFFMTSASHTSIAHALWSVDPQAPPQRRCCCHFESPPASLMHVPNGQSRVNKNSGGPPPGDAFESALVFAIS